MKLILFGYFVLFGAVIEAAKMFKSMSGIVKKASTQMGPMMQKATQGMTTLSNVQAKMQQGQNLLQNQFQNQPPNQTDLPQQSQQSQQAYYPQQQPIPQQPLQPPFSQQPIQPPYSQQPLQLPYSQQPPNVMNQMLPRGVRQYEPQPGINPHSYYKEYYRNEYLDRLESFLRRAGIKPVASMSRKDRKRLRRIKESLCYDDDDRELEREQCLDEETEEDLGGRKRVKGYRIVPLYE